MGGGESFNEEAVFNVMNIYPHVPLKRLNRKPCPDWAYYFCLIQIRGGGVGGGLLFELR